MTNTYIAGNLTLFELAILILLSFVAVYFIHLAFRDYRNFKTIRNLSDKIRELITGNYTDDIHVVGDPDLVELAQHINDLSKVFRLTHENLAQEKNRLASILTYMTDGVLATDRAGNITMINETAQRIPIGLIHIMSWFLKHQSLLLTVVMNLMNLLPCVFALR